MQELETILKNHKLDKNDYAQITKILNRAPNLLEIGIFSAMWSEHCSYKSSKIYLQGFPTKGECVVQGPGENAGIIDIGGGYCAAFKMESHNHPSFIEPYAGAATGVGGIMRDIFTMGARPVASLDSIRFGEITDKNQAALHKYLLRGVVKGIGDYGNCMGVPTIGGETSFESCYQGNILVNAFNLGIVKKDKIFYGRAQGNGNKIIYAGSKTGRDGLGGAVMSSDSFNEESKNLRPTVQVGDPFSEKLLLESCLEIFGKNLIIGIQDMGAAGLTSSSFEMASRANAGMKLDLALVPTREPNMSPYELMLSESQERMLICAKNGCEEEILAIFKKWEVDAAVIGEVTQSGKMELFFGDDLVGEIPIAPLSDAAPILKREIKKPVRAESSIESSPEIITSKMSQNNLFKTMLSHPEIADKSFIYNQYDSTILNNTLKGSGSGDASVIRIRENGAKLAMSLYCNPRFCYLNPNIGAKISVATAGRNCASAGAKPLAITDCLNFGSPNNPSVMWEFSEACEGIKQACEILKTPVVSGNVSLHNQSDNIDIYPTPSIGMVGQIFNQMRGCAFMQKDNLIAILGNLGEDFGGSLAQKIIYQTLSGRAPNINLYHEFALWEMLINADFIISAKAIKNGGAAIALAKMALLGGFGINVESGFDKNAIFSETQSCAIIEIAPNALDSLQEWALKLGIPYKIIGSVAQKNANINIDGIAIAQEEARRLYFESFEKLMRN